MVLSWVMQLRSGGSGDVMEFTMSSGGTLEVRLGECSLPSNMAIVGTVSKAPMGKPLRDGVERTKIAGFSDRMQKELVPKSGMVSLD